MRTAGMNKTVLAYFSIFLLVLLGTVISARYVLFRPWTGRTYAAITANEENIYVTGGIDSSRTPRNEIYQINLKKKTLRRIGKLPTPLYAVSTVIIENKLYIAGGFNGKEYSDSVMVFDTSTHKLSEFATLPAPRGFGALVYAKGNLYYLGGFDGSKLQATILEIDPDSGQISQKAELPQALEFHNAVVCNDQIYVIGGENSQLQNTRTFLVIDPDSGSVIREEELPAPRVRFGAALINDSVFLAGGWGKGLLSDVICIPLIGAWSNITTVGYFPEGFSDYGLASWQGALYLVGGVEEELKRQLKVIKIDPVTFKTESLHLRSYSWW